MIADTAMTICSPTPYGTVKDRSFTGLSKLFPVHKINAGLSYWGWSHVKGDIKSGVLFDWWISDFLMRNHDNYDNIFQFAQILETELRDIIPIMTDKELQLTPLGNGGVHLSGFTEYGEKNVPIFWHIHNGISQALPDKKIDPKVVNANMDLSPKAGLDLIESNDVYFTTNGEIEIFLPLFDSINGFVNQEFLKFGIITPIPRLLPRADYYKSIFQLISSLYQVSGEIETVGKRTQISEIPVSIGNEVTILTISNGIIKDYFTS